MAWNEPGGNNQKDPWGGGGGNRGNDGPPDLDEALKNLQKKLNGIFGGSGGNRGNGGSSSGFNGAIFGVFFVILAGIYAFAGAGIVNEQERAVVLRLGEYSTTKEPGFRWNPPLIDKVYTVNVTKVESVSFNEQMLTKDLNIVDINMSVQFVIDDARAFVLQVRDPVSSLRQASNSALRHVSGSTLMHDILTEGRGQVAIEVKDRLQAYLDNYQTGISVETVNVEDSRPPREVQAAFDDVIKAREDEERYKNEAETYSNGIIPEARGQAQRMIEEASAYKEQVIAQSEGEAQRFTFLLEEYKKAPEVTRQRIYLETVQEVMANSSKVLVDVEGGNNMMYLPLDKMMSNTGFSGAGSTRGLTSAEMERISGQVAEQVRRELNANPRTTRGGR